jgi:Family of unknown function (DUF5689)/Secretion system C-terminal sorting domain/Endonuclease/Exonuclease/phosphatase family
MSNNYFLRLFSTALLLFSLNASFAQINLATWNFENSAVVSSRNINVTASDVSLSAGTITYSAGVTGQAISGSSWSQTTSLTKYFEFTITPATNFNLSLASIVFSTQVSATGPTNWALRSNIDGYTANLASGTNPAAISADNQTANLGSTIQNRATAVTFRIYGYSASSTGTFRMDDLKIIGTVNTTLPNITLSKTNMSFGSLGQGSLSTPLSYTVIGSNLIDNVAINASSGYTICETPNGVYTSTLSLTPASGSVNVPIYVKQNNDNLGSISGTITNSSASTILQTVITSGFINATLTSFSPISTARAATNGTAVTVQGYVTVSSQFGGNQIFIQDGTGGISVFNGSENFVDVYGLQIGDFVQISGTRGSFNSLAQINVPMTIQKNATPPSVQTPITIASTQMSAYEGQLVRIINLPNPPGATTFAANTNYAFNTTQVRITGTVNAPFSNNLVGTVINTGTSNITGIASRFNSTFQLSPRFVADIENVNSTPFYGNDLNFGTSTTLDIGCWNIEWLGHPTEGPSNNTQQKDYAGTVLNTLKLDIINVNEVSDEALLGQVAAAAGSNYAYTCSQEVSNVTLSVDPLSQRVCFIYNTDVLTNVSTTALLLDVKANPASFFPNATLGYPNYPENDPSNFFASGRLPYAMTADVTINGLTKRMMFVGMHAKANTAPTDISYYRRQLDIRVLKDKMDQLYPNIPFVVMGDFNDDIDVSIYNAAFESTYKNFVDDVADYRFLTGQTSLTDRKKSTVAFNEMIDHIMISNEMFNAYESSSARVGTPDLYIPSYGSSTSDHYPVMARFNIANITLPVTLLDFKANLKENKTTDIRWDVADEKNFKHYIVEKSRDGRTFFAFKQVKSEGINQYTTIDELPYNGTTYYRLKMVDNDDAFEYSKVISVDKKALDKTFKVYPNPSSNVFFVENTVEARNPDTFGKGVILDINVYNINGQVVKRGLKTNSIDISDLSNGMYIIEGMLDNSVVLREKLFKN